MNFFRVSLTGVTCLAVSCSKRFREASLGDLLGVTTDSINTPLVFFIDAMISPEQFHVVSKNSISASVGMQRKFLINGIQCVGVSRSFSLTFSIMRSCYYINNLSAHPGIRGDVHIRGCALLNLNVQPAGDLVTGLGIV